jgi:4-amino-4-deoxy-L-arabinose transferase-like glycosyltransferase
MTLLRRHAPLLLGILAVFFLAPIYWTALQTPAIGIYHDDAIYLTSAKSLADGHGYRLPSTPSNMPQTKYPPLYPLALALVWKLAPHFPANVVWFKALSLAFALAWFAVSWLLLRRLLIDSLAATLIVAVTAASPQVVFLATAALSETLFALLFTAALWGLWRMENAPSVRLAALTALLCALACLTRSIGIVLPAVGTLLLLRRRQWSALAAFAGVAGAMIGPWILWQFLNRDTGDAYLSQANYYQGFNVLFNYAWEEKLRIVGGNLLYFVVSPYVLLLEALPKFLGFAAGTILAIAFALGIRRLKLSIAGTILGTLLMLVLWAWPPYRFLVPLLPILLAASWIALPRSLAPVMFPALFVAAATTAFQYGSQAERTQIWCPTPVQPMDWRAFTQQMRSIHAQAKANDLVQSNLDPTVYLFTGRSAIRGFQGNVALGNYLDLTNPLADPAAFCRELENKGVRWVSLVRWKWFSETIHLERLVDHCRQSNPAAWQLVNPNAQPGFELYSFRPGSVTR